jgi:hypothetical protein
MGGVSIIIIMIPVSKNVAAYQGKIQKQLMHVKVDRVDLNNVVWVSDPIHSIFEQHLTYGFLLAHKDIQLCSLAPCARLQILKTFADLVEHSLLFFPFSNLV